MLLFYLKAMRTQNNKTLLCCIKTCCIPGAMVCDYHHHCYHKAVTTYLSSIRNCIDLGQLPAIGANACLILHLPLIYLLNE